MQSDLLDPILCEHARSFKSTQLRFRWRFEELRQEDGSVLIPEPLRTYIGGLDRLTAS